MPESDEYIEQFEPHRDDDGRVQESAEAYVYRMQAAELPHWPKEVLTEWFYRHHGHIDKYAFLEYETFRFEKQSWPLARVPGGESFDDEQFFDNFSNIEVRAQDQSDWLVHYMLKNGTWNTPIILLHNPRGELIFPSGNPLKSPYHLLEGHRRLSFLNGLKRINKALAKHVIWLVTLT